MDSAWGDLPEELLLSVLRFLPLEDLCRVQRVCKRLLRAAAAPSLWENLYRSTFLTSGGGGTEGVQTGGPAKAAEPAAAAAAGTSSQHTAAFYPHGFIQRQHGQQQQGEPPPRPSSASEAVAAAAPAAGGIAWPSGSGYKRKPEAGERPSAAAAVTSDGVGIDWRERFKAQFVEQGRRQRLRRQARRLKADSALAVVRQEVHRLEAALAREQRELPLLQAQLVAVQRARQQASAAVLSQRYWLPVAVQQAHGVVTGQTPQDAEGREAELRQHVVVAELELRKLGRQLAAKRAWEAEARRRLAALQP